MGDMYRYDDRAAMIGQFHSFRYYPKITAPLTVRSGGKTYQVSLSQSDSAGGSAVFPEGVPVGGDGTFSITIALAGGTGKYLCQIGYFWDPSHYVEETVTSPKSYTLRMEPGVTAVQVAIQGNDSTLPTPGAVIFEFKVA